MRKYFLCFWDYRVICFRISYYWLFKFIYEKKIKNEIKLNIFSRNYIYFVMDSFIVSLCIVDYFKEFCFKMIFNLYYDLVN